MTQGQKELQNYSNTRLRAMLWLIVTTVLFMFQQTCARHGLSNTGGGGVYRGRILDKGGKVFETI